MKIDILTLFPEMFSPLENSIVGKAREKGLLEINYHNFRENAEKARHVDDEPYDGGQGMLLRAQPIFDAFDAIEKKNPRVILLDPAGRTFDQRYAEELAQEEELNFICGHYEGYDERIKTLVADEISLGDYVLLDNPKTIERLGLFSSLFFCFVKNIFYKMQDIYCKIENIVYNKAIKTRKEKHVAKNLKLKMARVEHDMTQGDLADAIG